VLSRTSGSHCRLIHPTDPRRNVTVPIHNEDLKRGTLRGIIACKARHPLRALSILKISKRAAEC
jgi:hypothetical protein